jgi:hypothetical protein
MQVFDLTFFEKVIFDLTFFEKVIFEKVIFDLTFSKDCFDIIQEGY